jgi:protocatechuate 3,4-dioxygenase alpha subunit
LLRRFAPRNDDLQSRSWKEILMSAKITPSQTIGPFFAYSLTPNEAGKSYPWKQLVGNNLVTDDTDGERIRIEGRMFDGAGKPIAGTLIEVWQADAKGRYAHPRDGRATNSSFKGFGRVETDAEGRFALSTIKPGAVPGPDGATQAPHIVVALHTRGILTQLYSRIYFADEAAANQRDAVLMLVPAARRDTLIARRGEGAGGVVYSIDFYIQGDRETVLFDL